MPKDGLHREVKARPARAGLSLSDYLLREVAKMAGSPPVEDELSRGGRPGTARLSETPAEAIRSERDTR